MLLEHLFLCYIVITMKYDSLFSRQELFVAAACVGAHANAPDGFRQREIKFLIELFSNWTESTLHRGEVSIRATQILRYLDHLVREGYARRLLKQRVPFYRLTRTGLLELLSKLAMQTEQGRGSRVLFVFYFLKNYRTRLIDLVAREGALFPRALKVELEEILDIRAFLNREIARTERELKKIDDRIHDAHAISALTTKLLKCKTPLSEVVAQVEQAYPYELNSQMPLADLIDSIPESARAWELQHGTLHRAADLWEPERHILECYHQQIKSLLLPLQASP